MKSSSVQNKQEESDLNESRRSRRWGSNLAERKSQALEISIHRLDRAIIADIKTRSCTCLRAAAKLADTANILGRSKRFVDLSKPRRMTRIPLPPISGSRTISGKVEHTDAFPAHRQRSAKPKAYSGAHLPSDKFRDNKFYHVLVTQGLKIKREFNKSNKISVVLGAGNKEAFQGSETCGRLNKQAFDGHPPATLPSAPVDALIRNKNDTCGPGTNDGSVLMPVMAKHDASLSETRQQREFCSDDSAIETESEHSLDKGCLERTKDDGDEEYYTDQRITEWVLKVNSSLFSTESDELTRSKRAEEQDVATIKIIYSGDWTDAVLKLFLHPK